MSWLKPAGALDRAFEVGIILKGLNGAVEFVAGIALLVVSPAVINHAVIAVTHGELLADRHDVVARLLLHSVHQIPPSAQLFAAIYLLSHGVAKIVLVIAVLQKKLWAYPGLIILMGIFIAYQSYRLTFAPSVGLALLTAFDMSIAVLTWLEYKKHRLEWGRH